MDTSSIKYGPGATREVGDDARDRGLKRVMLFSDPNLTATDGYATARDSLRAAGLDP
jgi:alcohol dehydrogenase class IV